MENDIALIKVKPSIKIDNDKIKPLPLSSEDVKEGKTVEVCGWGVIDDCDRPANDVQCIKQTIISNGKCEESHKVIYPYSRKRIFPSHICASNPKDSTTCVGDEGGPLVVDGKIIGITSWGKQCTMGGDQVYTRVSQFVSWINSTMSGK